MRLTDVISSLGLTFFPIAGMVLFLTVFAGVLLSVSGMKRRAELEKASFLPLQDDAASRTRSDSESAQ